MKIKNLFLYVALVALAALLLVACGGSSESGPGEVSVSVVDEFNYDPANLTLTAGDQVQITFENTGSVEHSFTILKAGEEAEHIKDEVDDEEHLHEALLLEIHEIGPGESATETFTVPSEPGDYAIACVVPGHIDAGMVGTLTVVQ